MAEQDNAGFPLAYFLLSTAQALEIWKWSCALEQWAKMVHDTYAVYPKWVLTDKDMAEISMSQQVWEMAKSQLCGWHQKKAVNECIRKAKLSTTPYNVQHAHEEFKFIDLTFVPSTHAYRNEYEGGNLEAPVDARAQSNVLHGPNAIFI